MSHDKEPASDPRRPTPGWRWWARSAVVVVLGLAAGVRLSHHPPAIPDCGAQGPTGPTPCQFHCVSLYSGSDADDTCRYDPAATTTIATTGTPPTTAPASGPQQPATPPPAAGGG